MTEGGYSPEILAKQETQEQQDTHSAVENESAKMSRADFLKLTGKALAGTALAGPMIEVLAACDTEPRRVTVEELLKNPDSFFGEDIMVEEYPVVLHKGNEVGVGIEYNPVHGGHHPYGKLGLELTEDDEWPMRIYATKDIQGPYIKAKVYGDTNGKQLPPVFPKDEIENIAEEKLKKFKISGMWTEDRPVGPDHILASDAVRPVKK